MFVDIKNFLSSIMPRSKVRLRQHESETAEKDSRKEVQLRRMRLILSQLEPVRKRPQTRLMKVDNISDVLRFMLRLCESEMADYRRIGGHMRCDMNLPKNAGTLSLREKDIEGNGRTLAILRLDIPLMNPQVERVIFRLRQHQQQKNNRT